MAGAALEKAKQPFTHAAEHDGRAVEGALELIHREREGASAVEAAAHEHRGGAPGKSSGALRAGTALGHRSERPVGCHWSCPAISQTVLGSSRSHRARAR